MASFSVTSAIDWRIAASATSRTVWSGSASWNE
jgi:hypothetical protein